MKKIIRYLLLLNGVLILMTSCSSKNKSEGRFDPKTGIDFSNPDNGGLSELSESSEQSTPPGMVFIEGGTFTMGATQQNIMGEYNNSPKSIHVPSFYLDDAEVTNKSYLVYLDWLAKVFPKTNTKYRFVYEAAVPDTTVWNTPLGNLGTLSKTYFRHRAFEDYPVVGISWLQANDYCKWRTNRVTEAKLVQEGILKPLYSNDSITVLGRNHFDAEVFEANPKLLFNGDRKIFTDAVTMGDPKSKKDTVPVSENNTKLNIGKHSPTPSFRLPTEVEWEYAARADIENRFYNSIRGRKKYAWGTNSTRDTYSKYNTEYANFKQGKGDYSGVAGWSSDGADITNRVKSYPPNAFGLYDMAGNVAEWVYDIYRPNIDNEENDYGYTRGNIFIKNKTLKNGQIAIANYNDIKYDTLPNGRIVPKFLPGQVIKEDVNENDTYLKPNYNRANNINFKDGDKGSTRDYAETDPSKIKSMYNAPVTPKPIKDENGKIVYKYDDKTRTTLITDRSRVYKGGSWNDREFWLDPGQRRFAEEYNATNYIGFRCAVDRMGGVSNEKTSKRSAFHQWK